MKRTILTSLGCLFLGTATVFSATTIAYWDQNSNALPSGGFGFLADPSVFPQAASQGSGFLTVGGGILNETSVTSGGDTVFAWLPSFGGSVLNAQPDIPSGGSISIQGGSENGNNGAYFTFELNMSGFTDLDISYATRGTATGFNTQTWSWSTDGTDFTDFWTVNDISTSAFQARSFSGLTTLDDAENAFVRVTFEGASASTGNNRLDNITFAAVPEPSVVLLLGLGFPFIFWRGRSARRQTA